MPFLGQTMDASSIDMATKELVIMRVSHINGCRYCLAGHHDAALAAGVTGPQLDAVCDRGDLDALAPRERAIVRWVDQITHDASGVSDELTAATLDHVREHQLVELTLLAGTITTLNHYCTAFDIPTPGGHA
jgi:AhpD family alkylhydroperoxidase